jgi:sirohydrochlorin ferrochelatase
VDFTSVEHATAALTNPKNHRLNGRHLVVEYASADAVRRGGGGDKRIANKKLSSAPRTIPKMKAEQATIRAEAAAESRMRVKAENRGDRSRPRPGAALAQAKRESVAIVPVQNQKITF